MFNSQSIWNHLKIPAVFVCPALCSRKTQRAVSGVYYFYHEAALTSTCCTTDGRGGTIGRKSASMWPLTRFWTSNHTAAQTQVTLSTEEATPTICLLLLCIMVKASAQGTTPHTATIQKEVRKRPQLFGSSSVGSCCVCNALVLFSTGFWVHCNDSEMKVCSVEEVCNTQAYILFYTQRSA